MTFNTAAKYELNKSIKNIVIDIRFSPKQMIPYTETKWKRRILQKFLKRVNLPNKAHNYVQMFYKEFLFPLKVLNFFDKSETQVKNTGSIPISGKLLIHPSIGLGLTLTLTPTLGWVGE